MNDIKPALEIKINTFEVLRRLGKMGEAFSQGSSRLKIAQARAINRTLGHMRTSISKDIRAVYYAKKTDVDKTMKLTKAKTGKNSVGSIRFLGDGSLPLIRYAKMRKNFVSVRVLKTARAKMIKPGGSHDILASKKGRARVWLGQSKSGKEHVFAMTGNADHPIVLWGPSFLAFFRLPGVAEQLRDQAGIMYEKRLRHEVGFMLSGSGAVDFGR